MSLSASFSVPVFISGSFSFHVSVSHRVSGLFLPGGLPITVSVSLGSCFFHPFDSGSVSLAPCICVCPDPCHSVGFYLCVFLCPCVSRCVSVFLSVSLVSLCVSLDLSPSRSPLLLHLVRTISLLQPSARGQHRPLPAVGWPCGVGLGRASRLD